MKNISFISVRTEVLVAEAVRLRQIELLADWFIVYSALMHGFKVIKGNEPLSIFRMHPDKTIRVCSAGGS
jgi:hypothetical protein